MSESILKVLKDGTKKWYLNGKLHKEDGPAVERSNGAKEWYLNGKFHRENAPAIEYTDDIDDIGIVIRDWFLNGKRHREDGPAIDDSDGIKCWYVEGREYDEKEYPNALRKYYRKLYRRGEITKEEMFIKLI